MLCLDVPPECRVVLGGAFSQVDESRSKCEAGDKDV